MINLFLFHKFFFHNTDLHYEMQIRNNSFVDSNIKLKITKPISRDAFPSAKAHHEMENGKKRLEK